MALKWLVPWAKMATVHRGSKSVSNSWRWLGELKKNLKAHKGFFVEHGLLALKKNWIILRRHQNFKIESHQNCFQNVNSKVTKIVCKIRTLSWRCNQHPNYHLRNKEEQIIGTQEKSQQIVAQRLLSCLQYLDATKSSAKDLPLTPFDLIISWQ